MTNDILEVLPDIHRLLIDRKETVATAESCTGGLVGAALTALPGSSAYMLGGAITYSNAEKMRQCRLDGVGPESEGIEKALREHGAVSQETATEMAEGIRENVGATYGVATTGIAGPGGAVPGKPVGSVWIAVSTPAVTATKLFNFDGDRDDIRRQTVRAALDMLYFALVGTL